MLKNKKGITLIEVVLTVAILGIFIPSIYTVFFAGQSAFSKSTNKGLAQESVRLAEIFLTDELKNTTGFISVDDFNAGIINQKIYELKYEDGYLLLTEYEKKDKTLSNGTLYDEKELRKLKGNWNKLTISSLTNGVLDVSIEQKEKLYNQESTYPLDFSITLINDDNLRNDKVWDLVKGDKLYFVKSNDALFGQIKIKEDVESGDGNGDNPGTENPIYKEIIITNIKIVNSNNKKELYKVDNPGFSSDNIDIKIDDKNIDIEITFEEIYVGMKIFLNDTLLDIGDTDTSININGVKLNNSSTISIKGTNNDTKTINITYTKTNNGNNN
jgi:type II secretory pathway pseudopilin PulG